MAKTNNFNSEVHSTLPYVDKQYKVLLDKLAAKNRHTLKITVEDAIKEKAEREGVKE